MISIEKLAEILNKELTMAFLEVAIDALNNGEEPIDTEHPDMEDILYNISDNINDLIDTLPLEDEYSK